MEPTFRMKQDPFLIVLWVLLILIGIKISSLILTTVGVILACLWFVVMDKNNWI